MQRDTLGRYTFLTYGTNVASATMGSALLGRILPTGSVDPSFGIHNLTAGLAAFGNKFNAWDLQLTGDGKILVAGTVADRTVAGTSDAILARFDASGNLDTTFGSGGVTSARLPNNDNARAVLLQSDGRIVLVSDWSDFDFSPVRVVFVTRRFLADGQLDPTYGSGGIGQIATSGAGSNLFCATLDSVSGNVVAAGSMLARWLP